MGAETVMSYAMPCCGDVLDMSRLGQPDWITHADGCEFDARMPVRNIHPSSIMHVGWQGAWSAAWVRVDGVQYELPCTSEDVAFYESVRGRTPDYGDPLAGIPSLSEVSAA